MTIESWKEAARRHEQREEWIKALDLYLKAIDRQEEEDEADIALHNRVGDIQIRLGDLEGAVANYERAIDLYREADLPNNAIAICRKIIRQDPKRPTPFLLMGRIWAGQGFLVDARQNFLTYAELMEGRRDTDEALRALEEFAGLAPRDIETRLFVAQQLVARERADDAVRYLAEAYRVLKADGNDDAAAGILDQIHAIDPTLPEPSIDDSDRDAETAADPTSDSGVAGGLVGFELTALGGDRTPAESLESTDGIGPEIARVVDADDLGGQDAVAFDDTTGPEIERDQEDADADLELAAGMFDFRSAIESDEPEPEETDSWAEDRPVVDADLEFVDDAAVDDAGHSEQPAEVEEPDEDQSPLPLLGIDEVEVVEVEVDDDEWKDLSTEIDEVEPSRAESAVELAVEERDAPDLESVEGLKAHLDREPSDADAWRKLGEAYYEAGEGAEGLNALDRAHVVYAENGDPEKAMRVVREMLIREPHRMDLRQRVVEYAHRTNERTLLIQAFIELADGLRSEDEHQKAEAVYRQVLTLDPSNIRAREALGSRPSAPSNESASDAGSSRSDYVDLGAMVLDESSEGTTRWVVPAELPTGDEEADFARMLSQFKEKVAQNISSEDATSHYDLGTAFKEMGLLDEAIGQFQRALRAQPNNLATFEMLGQCFLDQGEAEVAIRTLERAIQLPTQVDDDLLGIYYFLGRAHEQVGNSEAGREFYEKIFSLDINFKDVTERLRTLR